MDKIKDMIRTYKILLAYKLKDIADNILEKEEKKKNA